jgi:6-phosphogluconolactonase (cycloisomerase 2 family)
MLLNLVLIFCDPQFGGGNGRVLTPTDDPAIFSDDAPVITFPANKSNPHETFELKNGDLLVPDLGADQIWHLKKNGSGAFEIFSQFPQPEGSGPRHIAVLGKHLNIHYLLRMTNDILQGISC